MISKWRVNEEWMSQLVRSLVAACWEPEPSTLALRHKPSVTFLSMCHRSWISWLRCTIMLRLALQQIRVKLINYGWRQRAGLMLRQKPACRRWTASLTVSLTHQAALRSRFFRPAHHTDFPAYDSFQFKLVAYTQIVTSYDATETAYITM